MILVYKQRRDVPFVCNWSLLRYVLGSVMGHTGVEHVCRGCTAVHTGELVGLV